jgi:hypothetical protein
VSTPRDPKVQGTSPANDNVPVGDSLRAELNFPRHLPIQIIEVEVFAELLDGLIAANDNEDDGL